MDRLQSKIKKSRCKKDLTSMRYALVNMENLYLDISIDIFLFATAPEVRYNLTDFWSSPT